MWIGSIAIEMLNIVDNTITTVSDEIKKNFFMLFYNSIYAYYTRCVPTSQKLMKKLYFYLLSYINIIH